MRNEERNALFFAVLDYDRVYVDDFDFVLCGKCPVDQARGKDKTRLNELFIMLDTETSKSFPDRKIKTDDGRETYAENPNYIVAWSCAMNVYGLNLCTVWGNDPRQICPFLERLHDSLNGNKTIVYVHQLAYDYMFLRRFLFDAFGFPKSQLNTKPHYPINIEFGNGICFRDSLILSQRSIEKWGKDMSIPDAKAVGKWDYDKLRNQGETFTEEELEYIECDVLAGVECLNAMRKTLNSSYSAFPYTNTGIVRNTAKRAGKESRAHQKARGYYYKSFEVYKLMTRIYHGGYTHANRHINGRVITGDISVRDFSSSYPFCFLCERMPCERFTPLNLDIDENYILSRARDHAFIFRFRARNVEMKNPYDPFPLLQLAKCEMVVDAVIDNGRIRECGYIDIYLNEIDFRTIKQCYTWEECDITEVYTAMKDFIPRWLRDVIYNLYRDKCELKSGDKVLYNIRKSMLNACYGMCVQRVVMDDIEEDYETGEYRIIRKMTEDDFEKAVKRRGTFLFYAWGCWCTSLAQEHVIQLSYCVKDRDFNALYIDTDSCFSTAWDEKALKMYNTLCLLKLKEAGYDPVEVNGKTYIPGVAELDKELTEFITVGCKRYAYRDKDGLKITVAGVPKQKGGLCLEDDITRFKSGFVFRGEITGKLTHIYQYVDDLYTDERGNIIGDSINLVPCDYLLDESIEGKLDRWGKEMIYLTHVYEEDYIL